MLRGRDDSALAAGRRCRARVRGSRGHHPAVGVHLVSRRAHDPDPSHAALRADARRCRPSAGRVCVRGARRTTRRASSPGSSRRCAPKTIRQVRYVLALDRCTDDTAALARAAIDGDERFEIIEIDACPGDWAGKVHAVHAGVTRSRGAADAEYLLFADADTLFSPGCIASALALMRRAQARPPEPPQHADARCMVRARRADRRGAGADAACFR